MPENETTLKGDALCDAYLAEIRRVYGDACADKSWINYDAGWYYAKVAQQAPDGSWGTWGVAITYRANDIVNRIDNLSKKVSYQTRQERLALIDEREFDYHIVVSHVWREHLDGYETQLNVPCQLIRNVQDMRKFRDVVNEAIRAADLMEGE